MLLKDINKQKIYFLSVEGSNYSIGYSIGEKTKKEINNILDELDDPNNETIEFSKKILKKCLKYYPQYVEELKGMANGAGVNFFELFVFNLEITRNLGCTSLAIRKRDGLLIGHNEDFSTNNVFLLKIKHINNTTSYGLAYYGILPGVSFSINNHGIIQTMNSLSIKKEKVGVPDSFIGRALIECKSISEAENILKKHKKMRASNFTLYNDQKISNFEITPNKINRMDIVEDYFVHTNHFISKELLNLECKKRDSMLNSLSRFFQVLTLIKISKRKDLKLVKKILSSHIIDKFPICRHTGSKTLASVILKSNEKSFYVCYGNPCKNKYFKFSIK